MTLTEEKRLAKKIVYDMLVDICKEKGFWKQKLTRWRVEIIMEEFNKKILDLTRG